MVNEMVVKKLRAVIKEFEDEKGEFSLVMLIPTEPDVIGSKVALIISAPWLNKKSPRQAIELILDSLRKSLSKVELPYITRITVVHTSDNSVKAINAAFNVKKGFVDIINCNIFGVQVEKAYILESHQANDSPKKQPPVSPSVNK